MVNESIMSTKQNPKMWPRVKRFKVCISINSAGKH